MKTIIGKILCAIGWHDWEVVRWGDVWFKPTFDRVCLRCHKKKFELTEQREDYKRRRCELNRILSEWDSKEE